MIIKSIKTFIANPGENEIKERHLAKILFL